MASLATMAATHASRGQCAYEVTAIIEGPDCGTFFGPAPIFPTAINDHGVVVGYFNPCIIGPPRPFMWSEEMGFELIPLPPGVSDARPADINNHGEIVGAMNEFSNGPHAFHWKNGVWAELQPLPGLPQARANAINNKGETVGQSINILTGPALACIWSNGAATEIELPGGIHSIANALNDLSSIVGQTSTGLQGSQRAFWWYGGATIEIPPLPMGTTSDATAVNGHDVVVGTSRIPMKSGAVSVRSWKWQDGKLVDLGSFAGNTLTRVEDINSAGQIVGHSASTGNGNQIPFLWQHGVLIDLREKLSVPPRGFEFWRVTGINQNGQLIGVGVTSIEVALVLTPIDRPLGDVNIDCVVDERDLIAVLEDWGPDKEGHSTDMVSSATFEAPVDGRVDGADLAIVLGNWSPRPDVRGTER